MGGPRDAQARARVSVRLASEALGSCTAAASRYSRRRVHRRACIQLVRDQRIEISLSPSFPRWFSLLPLCCPFCSPSPLVWPDLPDFPPGSARLSLTDQRLALPQARCASRGRVEAYCFLPAWIVMEHSRTHKRSGNGPDELTCARCAPHRRSGKTSCGFATPNH